MSLRHAGQWTLESGDRVARNSALSEVGRFYVGPQGVGFEGELTLFQEGDPPKLRLASRGGSGGGGISFNVMRPDDIQEEIALVSASQAEQAAGATDLRGQVKIMVRNRTTGEIEDQVVITPAYSPDGQARMYLNKPVSHLGPFNIPGQESPKTSYEEFGLTGTGAVPPPDEQRLLISDDLRFLAIQQDDANFVVYRRDTMQPVWSALEHPEVQPGPPVDPPPPPPDGPPQTLARATQLLTALMLEMAERYGQGANYAKVAEDAPILLAQAQGYDIYNTQADPLMAAFVGAGWPEKYDREFHD